MKTSRCVIFIFLFFKFTLIRAIATSVIYCNSGTVTTLVSSNTVTSSATLWIIFLWIFIDRIWWVIIASRSPFGPITPGSPLNNNVSRCRFCGNIGGEFTCRLISRWSRTLRRCNLNIQVYDLEIFDDKKQWFSMKNIELIMVMCRLNPRFLGFLN